MKTVKSIGTKGHIVQKEDPVLRKIAKPVPAREFGSAALSDTVNYMRKALHGEDDGVAIAAPQIGVSQRIFVISGRTLAMLKTGKQFEEIGNEEELDDLVFINPEIVRLSRKKHFLEEGCLSVRWLYGKVNRAEKARVRAHDADGHIFTIDGSGLLAQIFQHEIDHLDGILFTDKAVDLEDLPPSERERSNHPKQPHVRPQP